MNIIRGRTHCAIRIIITIIIIIIVIIIIITVIRLAGGASGP
jgi:hypothetical protein